MPVTVEHGDMLQPQGQLTPALFPDLSREELERFLDAKLCAGYDDGLALIDDDTRRNKFAIAWAYSQAYHAIWQRLSATPSTAGIQGEASFTITNAQIDSFAQLSARYLAESAALLPTDTSLTSSRTAPAVRNRFVW